MKEAVILFTRVPVPGMTKTRLMPCWTGQECAELHRAFLRDELAQCALCGRDLFLFYTPADEADCLRDAAGVSLPLRPQEGDGLGERMLRAIRAVLAEGYGACVLIGSDIPELQAGHLERAFALLETSDAVFLPTADGGYCLAGMKAALPEAFSGQSYGHGAVMDGTAAALRAAGRTVSLMEPLCDVDTPEDLLALRRRLQADASVPCRETRRYLDTHRKVSVIVPVYNEEAALPAFLRETEKLPDCELLFADGGSTDRTPDLLAGYRVLASEKGRAAQMNRGAAASGGDVLLFLHADSVLPDAPVPELLEVLERYRWGCFGVSFRPGGRLMKICARQSNRRAAKRGIVFGDQGIFLPRDLFFEVGQFPALPLMEDYQFSLNLRALGARPGLAAHPIVTSSRRFGAAAGEQLRTMAQMARLRRQYRSGADIREIAARYRDIR